MTAITVVITLLPTGTFFLARTMLNPEGFWQEFAVLGVGVYLLAGLQILFGIGGIVFLFIVWSD